MDISNLSEDERTEIYENFKDQYLTRHPESKFPDIDSFFEQIQPPKKSSLLKRIYHTLF